MQFENRLADRLSDSFDLVPLDIKAIEDVVGNLRYPGNRTMKGVIETARSDSLNCKSVLIERYISTDFHDEYAAFHSRVFQDVPRTCFRLHFLAESNIKYSDVINQTNRFTSSYRGYTVLRPLGYCRVGETMLYCPHDRKGAELVHCQIECDSHLLGYELPRVRAMPFIQQETHIMACAGASLWTVARYLHGIGECRRYRPSELAGLVTDPTFSARPSKGLEIQQMCAVMQMMDLNRTVDYPKNENDALEQIYMYVESELPVIVGVLDLERSKGHALTIIGHEYPSLIDIDGSADSLGHKINALIAHDDKIGPYRQLQVGVHNDDKGRSYLKLGKNYASSSILVPLPPRVNITADRIRTVIKEVFDGLPEVCPSAVGIRPGGDGPWTRKELSGLVTRAYLRRNHVFKEDIAKAEHPMDAEFIFHYWKEPMPKYIWVVEIYSRDSLRTQDPIRRTIRGEVILDSTASHWDPYGAVISIHLNGRMWTREGQPSIKESRVFVSVQAPCEYSPLIRRATSHKA